MSPRSAGAELRWRDRRIAATDRVLDILSAIETDAERAVYGQVCLMLLARDMPSIAQRVLNQADAALAKLGDQLLADAQ